MTLERGGARGGEAGRPEPLGSGFNNASLAASGTDLPPKWGELLSCWGPIAAACSKLSPASL